MALSSVNQHKPAGGVFSAVDTASGFLALLVPLLAPWLFGTTEQWAILTMNGVCYLAGVLWLLKWLLRWRSGALAVERIMNRNDPLLRPSANLVRAMGVLTLLILFYCLVAALNSRATFIPEEHRFEYRSFIRWLPSTYASELSWHSFWNYLALACGFWALRDWLLHPPRQLSAESEVVLGLPPRMRRFLWALAINASILSLIGIFQRLSGTDRLLWFRRGYGAAENMFGPFAYNGNAAQYINLAWPVILGFWWTEREKARLKKWEERKVGGSAHIVLLLASVICGAAPLVAGSQGGALVTFSLLGASTFIFLVHRRGSWQTRCVILLVSSGVLGLGGALGWDQLAPRLRETFRTPYANPNELYENARQMALDYPLFGIGPGAFRAIYPLYRQDPEQTRQAFLHDDWLETRVTFGWFGSMMILCLLGLALTRWFLPGGVFGPWEFVAVLWVAVVGCLAHAKFSFPLQVYSILSLLLAELALLSALSRPSN